MTAEHFGQSIVMHVFCQPEPQWKVWPHLGQVTELPEAGGFSGLSAMFTFFRRTVEIMKFLRNHVTFENVLLTIFFLAMCAVAFLLVLGDIK
jgi:hypothetical protein